MYAAKKPLFPRPTEVEVYRRCLRLQGVVDMLAIVRSNLSLALLSLIMPASLALLASS